MPRLARLLKFSISAAWQAVRFWLDTPDGAPVAAVASGKEADLFCFLTMLIEGDAHAAPHHR